MLLFIPVIFALIFGIVVYDFPQLISFTAAIAQWCQNLFLQCLEYLLIIKMFFLWFGIVIVGAMFTYAILKGALTLFRTYVHIKGFPKADYGDFVAIKDDRLKTAFTHGLFNPRIYISTGLVNSLDSSELKAVYLHELHHKNSRDPLRFFLLSILKDTFFYIPIGRFVEKLLYSKIEIEADKAVVLAMQEPMSLAGALLKITGFNKNMVMIQQASISGFGSTEGRVRRLIEETSDKIKLPAANAIIVSVVLSGLLIFSLGFPLFASLPKLGTCDTSRCAVHINKLGMDCKTHCEASQKHIH
ncbi:MAG: hypothetical protein A3G39_04885 [Deltaproteobacteria bacterium RIFCSPLOWO2_12_FULL_43_16]|nr:MAG: hypothetical protein A2Z89_09380 [Deltaproteobacteria bacterium GWA2_43_19]OGQ10068.1 MAG: hypothetical protein A3D30_08305 [Deltaproteobacteria bacterium RIFCSPHIGHO2_02_FULL_43_33]OGQ59051.1 MAG: hypothetical protein A3G39_04885 [Deltaproteobacteria bacterium RIFCSPLOWO2_12_FULL_43_16]HBR18462.1 hypothetical protein [Deltaproteobacteria bacterium]